MKRFIQIHSFLCSKSTLCWNLSVLRNICVVTTHFLCGFVSFITNFMMLRHKFYKHSSTKNENQSEVDFMHKNFWECSCLTQFRKKSHWIFWETFFLLVNRRHISNISKNLSRVWRLINQLVWFHENHRPRTTRNWYLNTFKLLLPVISPLVDISTKYPSKISKTAFPTTFPANLQRVLSNHFDYHFV
jgi:hypothetical protein